MLLTVNTIELKHSNCIISQWVRLDNFAQKIFNRTDRPILVRKLFTNAFSTPFCWRTSLIDALNSRTLNACLSTNCYVVMTLHCLPPSCFL